MPVVRGPDYENIDILLIQELSEVSGNQTGSLRRFGVNHFQSSLVLRVVDIAQGNALDVLDSKRLAQIGPALAPAPDKSCPDAIVGPCNLVVRRGGLSFCGHRIQRGK